MSNLVFSAVARERWIALNSTDGPYERAIRRQVHSILDRLDRAPARHRVGATQFQTNPATWGELISADTDGADWIVIWTTTAEGSIYILRNEPAPSL